MRFGDYVLLSESELPKILLSMSRIYTLASTRLLSVSAVCFKLTTGDLRRKSSSVRNFSNNVVILFSLDLFKIFKNILMVIINLNINTCVFDLKCTVGLWSDGQCILNFYL